MQEPKIQSVPVVVKFDEDFDTDDYSSDGVSLNNNSTTTTTPSSSSSNNGMTLYYIGVEGSTKSTTIDPSRSWALQIARVYGCPCTVDGSPFSSDHISDYKSLLKRFTFWVSLADLLMFLVALACGGGFAGLGTNVLLGPTERGLANAGAKYTYRIVENMQFYRLLTAVLLHCGLLHMAVNLYAQLRLGAYAEGQWGSASYALVYGASGVGGVLLSAVFSPETVSVGASGAMAGVLAALALYVYAVPEPRDPIRRPAIVQIGVVATLLVVLSASSHVDLCAHLGGALVGVLFGLAFWGARLESIAGSETLKKVFPVVMYVLMALYFVACLVTLYAFVYSEPITF